MARKKVEDAAYEASAERTKRSVSKYGDAGLKQIKVWVAKDAPEAAEAIRKYAARKPKTKAILKGLKDS